MGRARPLGRGWSDDDPRRQNGGARCCLRSAFSRGAGAPARLPPDPYYRSDPDYVRKHVVDKQIINLSLKNKKPHFARLLVADLVVSPIGRHLNGKKPQPDWEIVESKFRRGRKGYQGYGLVVLP